ncbi:unnamed protein product [Auanema sp. JU1783]|nr:unnamed protein product [Auanema sp. JU1783]
MVEKWLICFLFFPLISSQFLSLNLHRHQSCPHRKNAHWSKKIEFEGSQNGKGATLEPTGQGCYQIKGKVTILEDLTNELLIYLSVSTTGDTTKPPEPCRDPNLETGCGGVGSCLFCRPCHSLEGIGKVLGAQLVVNGKTIGCEPLKKGSYDDVQLKFCVPEVSKLIAWQGISEQAIDHILAATTQEGNSVPKLNLFVTVFIFDKDVRPLLTAQRKLESRIKELRNMTLDSELDSHTYWNLPFNQIIKKQTQFIGCHKLFGTVSLTETHN